MIFKVMIILAKKLFKVIRKKFKKKLALASKSPTLKKDTIRNPLISKKIKQTSKRSKKFNKTPLAETKNDRLT